MKTTIKVLLFLSILVCSRNAAFAQKNGCPPDCKLINKGVTHLTTNPKSYEALKLLMNNTIFGSRLSDKKLTVFVIDIRGEKIIFKGDFYLQPNGSYKSQSQDKDIDQHVIDAFLKKQSMSNTKKLAKQLLPLLELQTN